MSTEKRATWETYTGAWREAAADAKAAALARSMSPSFTYQDPLKSTTGHAELMAYMRDFHQQVPGGHFVTTRFFEHHDTSIAQWNMLGAEGQVLGDGTSFGQYDAQGALVSVTGFFEVPA